MDMERFGNCLAESRRNKGMTQEEFASRMGVTAQAVSKWERGQSLPDISLLCAICDILDADVATLLNIPKMKHITESNDSKEQQELLNNLCAEPLQIIFGEALITVFVEGLKTNLVAEKRLDTVKKTGILVPVIRIRDAVELGKNEYCITAYDKVLCKGKVEHITDNTYEVLINEVFEQCRLHYDEVLNKQLVKNLVDHIREEYPGVVEKLIPEKISYLFVKKVLAELVREKKSIHNMIGIIEVLEEEVVEKGNTDIKEIAKLF